MFLCFVFFVRVSLRDVLCLVESFMLGFKCDKREGMLGSVPSRSLHGLPRINSSIRYRLCSKPSPVYRLSYPTKNKYMRP